jgi:spore germination protein
MMEKGWTRRARIRAASFLTAVVLVLAGGCAFWYLEAQSTQRQLEAVYLRGLGELGDYMTGITNTLSKGIYAGTPAQMATLSAQLWRDSGAAKTALSSLPAANVDLSQAYRFLSQVGDYATRLSAQMTAGQNIGDKEMDTLEGMLQYSQELTQAVYQIEDKVRAGEIRLLQAGRGDEADQDQSGGQQQPQQTSGMFDDAGKLEGYATLIYDGPFSDHMLEIEPRMTKGAPPITAERAMEIARGACGEQEFLVVGEEASRMASYRLEGGESTAGVTKNGGYLSYLTCGRPIADATIDARRAVELASAFLVTMGYENMKATYFETANGECTVNFAYAQEDAICYPDLVKVGVAMDNGEVVFVDARSYLVNHYERSLPASDPVSPEQAQASLGTALEQVTYVGRAVIPTDGGNEKLCHEFSATGKNGHNLLCYVNTETGEEERLLILIKTEQGVLTV